MHISEFRFHYVECEGAACRNNCENRAFSNNDKTHLYSTSIFTHICFITLARIPQNIFHKQYNIYFFRVSDFRGMQSMGCSHFESLFKDPRESSLAEVVQTTLSFPIFVEEDNYEYLMAQISEEEFKSVIHKFQKDKSLGPDGWGVELFEGLYAIMGKDLLVVVEEYKRNKMILPTFNLTFIALIPRKDSLNSFEDFRMISLCNVVYQFITKIISNRIKLILSTHISYKEFGFFHGQQIHEAIGVA